MSSKPLVKQSLTEGPIAETLTKMALPMAGGILATLSFSAVDTLFVAALGKEPLAALSFTVPIVMIGVSLAVGLGAGTSSVVAIAAGKHDDQLVKELITDSMTLTCILCLIFSALGILTIGPLFSALGATEEILPLIHDYMVPWYVGLTFIVVPMVGLAAMRALGDAKMQANFMIFMAVANAVLDPFLIFGWWIFPRMEIQGAAVASLVVRVVSVFFLFYYMHYKMHLFANPMRLSRILRSARDIFHVGIPAMATNIIIPISGSLVIALVASHGADAVAGFGVAARVEAIGLILFYALSAVVGPFCGQNLGAGKFDRLFDAQKICAKFCLLSGIFLAVVLALSGGWLASFFSDDANVIGVTYSYLLIVPISYGVYGIVMVVNASFNGLQKPMPGVAISSVRVIFALLPLAWLGNYIAGLSGVFVAIALSNLLVGLWAYLWVNKTISSLKPAD